MHIYRIVLNLTGIDSIDAIGKEAKELMAQIDSNNDGSICRAEWIDIWMSKQETLGKFVDDKTFKKKMEINFGKEGPTNIPLYAFGNRMSFYRLPSYPDKPEDRPEGGIISNKYILKQESFSFFISRLCFLWLSI